MAKKINGKEYEAWSKEELIKEIVKIKSTTYGLVWHRDLPEEKIDILINPDARTPNEMFPNEMAGKPFPVLKEVKSKAIESDKSKLVNLLIEGDNYHSLAVLNFTHREAVDLIYIDPPYNTGNNDFIYNDKFVDREDSFRHSKWLSFMEKRLKLAKNLLKSTGVIFISIDDNEQAPLRMLCDEIFGQENFITTIIWQKKYSPQNDAKYFSDMHDFVLVYAKKKNYGTGSDGWKINLLERTEEQNARYSNPDNDKRGVWKSSDLLVKTYSAKYDYEIITPSKRKVSPPRGRCWRVSKEKYVEMVIDNRIWFGKNGDAIPSIKRFLSEVQQGIVPSTIWFRDEVGDNQEASQEIKDILGFIAFDNPKPTRLIKRILQLSTTKKSTVLDFFAGSGTTGHAVLQQNEEDGGHRNFIICTNDESSICKDICYPRVRKVIDGYKNQKGEKIGGLGGNLKYYMTDFVEAEPTDKNKRKLVKESTDMLCILENAFELVQETPEFKIFKNTDKYVGVIFYEEAIGEYKKAIKKIDGHFNTYVFSMSDDPHARKFADVKKKVTLCAIPEVILKVYREIFK
ncbi:MAG: DNA methyltransferase [Patescibacteria group bacterium]|nr:DNA methyltransferase [Patescibacteria group bacterium]